MKKRWLTEAEREIFARDRELVQCENCSAVGNVELLAGGAIRCTWCNFTVGGTDAPKRCAECNAETKCTQTKAGAWSCEICLMHAGQSRFTEREEKQHMKRIDFREQARWANKRPSLWRGTSPNPEEFVNALLDKARVAAFGEHMREMANENHLDLTDYPQRIQAATLALEALPDWRVDTVQDLSDETYGRVEAAYSKLVRAADVRAARDAGSAAAWRPDPTGAARDAALARAADTLGVDLTSGEGIHAALAAVHRENPALLPSFGRGADVAPDERAAFSQFTEASERIRLRAERERAEPAAAPALPPQGGFYY